LIANFAGNITMPGVIGHEVYSHRYIECLRLLKLESFDCRNFHRHVTSRQRKWFETFRLSVCHSTSAQIPALGNVISAQECLDTADTGLSVGFINGWEPS